MSSSCMDFNNISIGNTYLMSSSSVNFNDSSIDSFRNISSASIPSYNDLIFKPIINFSYTPGMFFEKGLNKEIGEAIMYIISH